MKITEDVRKFAAEQKVSEHEALQIGLEQEAREFAEKVRRFSRRPDSQCGKVYFLKPSALPFSSLIRSRILNIFSSLGSIFDAIVSRYDTARSRSP